MAKMNEDERQEDHSIVLRIELSTKFAKNTTTNWLDLICRRSIINIIVNIVIIYIILSSFFRFMNMRAWISDEIYRSVLNTHVLPARCVCNRYLMYLRVISVYFRVQF